jgi:hypothetical protein
MAIVLMPMFAFAQTPPGAMDTPIVHAGVFGLRPDGSVGGSAVDTAAATGEELSGTVYIAPCASLGASSGQRPISASATDAWRLSGRVTALSETQAALQLTWQRLRQGGQDVMLPEQTVSLTLNRGERTRLDSVTTPAAGVCAERSAALDVVFASLNELRGWPAGTFSGAGSFAGGRSGSGGVGGPAGGGNATGTGADTGAEGSGGGGRSGGGGGGAVRVLRNSDGGTTTTRFAVAGRPQPSVVSADLWLVRGSAGAPDETSHLTVSSVRSLPSEFSFPALTIPTTSGVLTVRVQGTLETGLSPEGQPRLFFSANRSVTFAPAGRAARDTAPVVEGSTKTSVAMPGPDDVLSFEMPPLQVPGGQTLSDRLSIRVRLTSQPMQE